MYRKCVCFSLEKIVDNYDFQDNNIIILFNAQYIIIISSLPFFFMYEKRIHLTFVYYK